MTNLFAFNKNTIPEILGRRATYLPEYLAYCFPELNQSYSWPRLFKSRLSTISDWITNRFSLMGLLPLYHPGGIGLLLTTLKSANIRTVMLSHYNPLCALEILEQEKCHFIVGTPFMIQNMLHTNSKGSAVLNSVLGLAFTSSAVNSLTIERVTQAFKKLNFFTVSYDSSEAGAVANGTCFLDTSSNLIVSLFIKGLKRINLLNGSIAYAEFSKTPYSIGGKADKNVDVQIRDVESGAIMNLYERGEILELKAMVSTHLSSFKIPKYFILLPDLPLSATGKISVEAVQNLIIKNITKL